jgi:hypothetical protein
MEKTNLVWTIFGKVINKKSVFFNRYQQSKLSTKNILSEL